jgi:hypothetical protein
VIPTKPKRKIWLTILAVLAMSELLYFVYDMLKGVLQLRAMLGSM